MKKNRKKPTTGFNSVDDLVRASFAWSSSPQMWNHKSYGSGTSSSDDDCDGQEAEMDMLRMMLRYKLTLLMRWCYDDILDDDSLLLFISGMKCDEVLQTDGRPVTMLVLSDCDGEVRFHYGDGLKEFKTVWDYDVEQLKTFLDALFSEVNVPEYKHHTI